MSEIAEEIYKKSFSKIVEHPFSIASMIKEFTSNYGVVEERENKVFSSGCGAVMEFSFDVVKNIDNVSSIVFSFFLHSEGNKLNIDVKGGLKTLLNVKEKTFNEFYLNERCPEIRPKARYEIKKIASEIEDRINKI